MYLHRLLLRSLLVASTFSWMFPLKAQDATPVKPAAYASTLPVNYVRTCEPQAPITDATQLATRPLREVKQTTQYVDGLGRPLQTVVRQGSFATGGSPVDMVSAIDYDAFGRETRKYLPFAANGNGAISNGSFKTDPFYQQAGFYSDGNANSPIKGQGETYYYSKTEYEASPLNRPERSYAPGNSWVHDGNGVKLKYLINTTDDAVRIWRVQDVSGDFGTYTTASTSGTYPAGELYKNVTEDERGKQVIEFKDKEGQVILKKVQLTATADEGTGKDHTGWLCTYYIYDDLNQLRCVIQPEGVTILAANGWDLSYSASVLLNEQCFRYEYDGRGRMTMKKVPGAAPVYMVYDKRDRLVMTQDGNLRSGTAKWLVTLYDELNRPVKTGLWTEANSRSYHEGQAASTSNYYYPFNTEPGSSWELLSETHYDDYSGLPSGVSSTFNSSGYSNYLNASTAAPDHAEVFPSSPSTLTRGVVTWTKVKVLGTTDQFLATVNLYDDKGRVLQTQSSNITGGLDVVSTQYSFSGQVLRTHIKHQKLTGTAQSYEVATKNSYDDLGRVSSIEKNINAGGWKKISELSYDALGQVKTKKLAPAYNSGAGLETLTFDYNIRGWLLGANRDYVKDASTTSYFGFDLGYDKNGVMGSYIPQFNGNISGTVWKSRGDGEKRKYDFSYDAVNRLTGAGFNQWVSGTGTSATFNTSGGINYSVENLSYDQNGNILTMDQKGWKPGGSDYIDKLSYSYFANSNKLKNVVDAVQDKDTKLGDFRYSALYEGTVTATKVATATDYSYDANGNMVKDLNKDIVTYSGADGIAYNYLNLPGKITVKKSSSQDKGTITYTYDAAGNKLKKVVSETGKPDKVTLYLYGIYEDDALQFLPMEEGRIRPLRDENNSITSFTYDYFIKDHLGNVRMVLTEEQKQDAYPPASMETAQATTEEALYSNINTTRFARSSVSGYPTNDTYTSPNDYVAKTNGSGNKIGPAIVLKVMAGDKFNVRVSSWYKTNGVAAGTPVSPLTDLLAALTNGIASVAGGKATSTELSNSGVLSPGATDFLNDRSYSTSKPKAYLNWILFDEQFNIAKDASGAVIAGGYSGADPVGTDQEFKIHQFSNLPIEKSGYLYVYVSNETPNLDVFFDNLQVTHVRGPLLEETHYYPFGLRMAGISSKAAGGLENKKKYNGIDWENDLDLAVYDAFFRELDPQTGRWWQIDPEIENMEAWSPYASNYDNPITYSDPLGDEPDDGGPDDPPSLGTRIWGAVKGVGGVLEMAVGAVGGAATSWTGIGAVAGGAAVVHGADVAAAGFTQLWTGKSTQSFTEQGISKGLQAAGVSEQKANTVAGYADAGVSIALTAGAGAAANGSKIKAAASTESTASKPSNLVSSSTKAKNAPQSTGIPNSSKIEAVDATGKTTKYSTYGGNGVIKKQVQAGTGGTRHGVGGATKKVPNYNTNPNTGQKFINGYKVKKAMPAETPPGSN